MNILQKLKDGANKATEKAQHVVEINKLNSQISDIEQRKGSYYLEMGKVFYEGYRTKDMSIAEKEMVDLAKSCDSLQEQIEELRNRIAILKNERLCQCGRTVALDAIFCPYCGNKLADLTVRPESRTEPKESKSKPERDVFYSEESVTAEVDEAPYIYRPELENDEVEVDIDIDIEEQPNYEVEDEEARRFEEEEREKERRHLEELERERERQLELDRRIRFWQENNQSQDNLPKDGEVRDTVKCQICSADLPKGSKWCPRCGAEQI